MATGSPTCFSQRMIVPSVTVSPSWGIVTRSTPPHYGGRTPTSLRSNNRCSFGTAPHCGAGSALLLGGDGRRRLPQHALGQGVVEVRLGFLVGDVEGGRDLRHQVDAG